MHFKSIYISLLLFFIAMCIRAEDDEVSVQDEDVEDGSNWNRTVSGEVDVSESKNNDEEGEKLEKKRAVEDNEIQEKVKAELDKAVESLKKTAKEREEEEEGGNGLLASLESCTPEDCNNRGTCIGTKKTFICACQLGYSGKNCEETVCDSARDCNGRGLCLGTTNQLTCLCNLGYTGRRCQTPI